MPALAPLPSSPSVVDFDPRHQIVLLCSPPGRAQTSELAECLLALGFDAFVLSGALDEIVDGLRTQVETDRPALVVACDGQTDTPVLRSRVQRSLQTAHVWLEGRTHDSALELQRTICERMDQLERERTQEVSVDSVPIEEVSNVVLLPTARASQPASVPPNSPARPPNRLHLVLWPLAGAALTALGMVAMRGESESPAAPSDAVVTVAPPITAVSSSPSTPPSAEAMEPPVFTSPGRTPSAPSVTVTTPPPDDTPPPSHERVTSTDDFLVFAASERPRDWYAAMDVCRGRRHAGLEGWTTPSSKQLNELAKARVLPAVGLWSRTRSLHDKSIAFVVHGHAGTVRKAPKSEHVSAAVCVRRRQGS